MNKSEARHRTIPLHYGNHSHRLLESFVVRHDLWAAVSQLSSSGAKSDLRPISGSGVEKNRMAAEKIGRRYAFPSAGAGFSALVIAAVFAQSASNNSGAPTRKTCLPDHTASGDLTQRRPLLRRRRSRDGGVFTDGAVVA
jgi:hypothetical protein